MKKEQFIENVKQFIEKGTCCFTCVKEIKEKLKKENYQELHEINEWNKLPDKFYVTRNDSSLIAIKIPNLLTQFLKTAFSANAHF